MSHFVTLCRKCSRVINQCRCFSKDKETRWEICTRCRDEATECLVHGSGEMKPVGILSDLKFSVQLELAFDYDLVEPEDDDES